MHACAIQHIQVSIKAYPFHLAPENMAKCSNGVVAHFFSLYQVNSYQNTKTRESVTLDYVACLMHNALIAKDAPFPGEKCARELQLPNWDVIRECSNSTEGSKLLQDHGERTKLLNPPLSDVPTITFNHVSNRNSISSTRSIPMLINFCFSLFFAANRQ